MTTMHPLLTPLRLLLLTLVLVAALTDWRWRRIPNWLTIPILCAAMAAQAALSGWPGLQESAGGLAVALLISMPLFLLRGLGGGDVKLMAAAGALCGPMNLVYLFIVNAILGGLAAIVLVLAKGRLGETLRNVGAILTDMSRLRAPSQEHDIANPRRLTLPRGVVFASATLLLAAARQL